MSEVFERKEKKYLLEKSTYKSLLTEIKDYIKPNKFFDTDVWSIYYDTDNNQLIRRSIEKPAYKEKLRIRSYGQIKDNKVYIELKKKLNGTVYKRRTKTNYLDALNSVGTAECDDKQVGEEIKYFIEYYGGLHPSYCIGTRRLSYETKDNPDIRITFDIDPVYRNQRLFLGPSDEDKELTDKVIMEIKVKGAMPLWLSHALEKYKIYPTSFSKVGTAYTKELIKNINKEI